MSSQIVKLKLRTNGSIKFSNLKGKLVIKAFIENRVLTRMAETILKMVYKDESHR